MTNFHKNLFNTERFFLIIAHMGELLYKLVMLMRFLVSKKKRQRQREMRLLKRIRFSTVNTVTKVQKKQLEIELLDS